MKQLYNCLILLGMSVVLSSCGAYKVNLLFRTGEEFNNTAFQAHLAEAEQNYEIKKFDYIQVIVYTNNGAVLFDPIGEFPFANRMQGRNFNNNQFNNNNNNNQLRGNRGFAVDENGQVTLPRIGQVTLAGLKLYQADSLLREEFKPFFQDPYVRTSYLNKRVVMMGALGNQIIPLTQENMTLLEVLSLAGDISTNVKANRIRLIRGAGTDDMVMQNIDLTTWKSLQDAELIIRPNDVIYVEPRRRVAQEFIRDTSTFLQAISGILTLMVTTFLLVDRLGTNQ